MKRGPGKPLTPDVGRGNPDNPFYPYNEPPSLDELRTYPFFTEVADRLLSKLQPNTAERIYEPGEIILRMGEYSDAAFYIAAGSVEVRLMGAEGEPPSPRPQSKGPGLGARIAGIFKRAAAQKPPTSARGATAEGTVVLSDMPVEVKPGGAVELGAGELFGEMSALSRYPISADVVAKTRTKCLLIATAALRKMIQKKEFAAFKEMIDERYRSRTLGSHLRRVDLFAELDDEAVDRLRDVAELASFEPGAVIVEQGTSDDTFYLVRGGFVKVGVRSGAGDLAVTYLRKGDYAGEVALLLDEPWPFSLSALEHVELVKISRAEFEAAISRHPEVEKLLWEVVVERLKERGFAARNPLSSQYLQMAMDTGLIHGESVLLIDLDKCTRCDDCVRGCTDTHGGLPRFIREGIKYRNWSVPTACYQCTDPVCMIGCPTGAITRPIGTAEVLINSDTCIGCGNCGRRCPWGNIISVEYDSPTLGREIQLATKCDQCYDRDEGPACVQMCPHEAAIRINFKEVSTVIGTLTR
jgi:CRP-like cAMP-binding protein/Fe-S-cluster-containing hydrogenase component 2